MFRSSIEIHRDFGETFHLHISDQLMLAIFFCCLLVSLIQ
jgi:hypothetical protein